MYNRQNRTLTVQTYLLWDSSNCCVPKSETKSSCSFDGMFSFNNTAFGFLASSFSPSFACFFPSSFSPDSAVLFVSLGFSSFFSLSLTSSFSSDFSSNVSLGCSLGSSSPKIHYNIIIYKNNTLLRKIFYKFK